jgi:hypothetical protein
MSKPLPDPRTAIPTLSSSRNPQPKWYASRPCALELEMMRASSSLGLGPQPGPFEEQVLQKQPERKCSELKDLENIRGQR